MLIAANSFKRLRIAVPHRNKTEREFQLDFES